MTPIWLDHALVVVLAVLFPIRGSTFGYHRLAVAPFERIAEVRRSLYLQAMAIQWTLAACVVALWSWGHRSWTGLGLVPRGLYGTALGLAAAAIVAIVLSRVRGRARRDVTTLGRYREKLQHLERMLPHSPEELGLFGWISITAGICEELLYRGYLLWYLGHWLGIGAVPAAAAIFGVGHAYQGWRGIVTTALVGVVMALIYLGSGSLWPAMAIHALIDIHSGTLAYAALTIPPQTPALDLGGGATGDAGAEA